MDTYFTFLDGALGFDCPSCGQACCRGKGAALDVAEVAGLVARAPALVPLVSLGGGGLAGWTESADGCWFLRDDGWCSIERDAGRMSKPVTCRLFPFNRVFRTGGVRVVDFNSVICPLRDAAATGVAGVTYGSILDDLAAVPLGPLTTSDVPLPAGFDGKWLGLESAVRDASASHLDAPATAFVLRQLSLAGVDVPSGALESLRRRWSAFYGLPPESASSARIARSLALLAPSLRFNTLFRRGGPAWPVAVARLPKLLLATSVLAEAAAALKGPPSLRALTELHQSTGPLRELLVEWDRKAVVVSHPKEPDVPPNVASALRHLFDALSPKRPPRALGDAIEATWSGLPVATRALALNVLPRLPVELRVEGNS